jgi:hypothetical protein
LYTSLTNEFNAVIEEKQNYAIAMAGASRKRGTRRAGKEDNRIQGWSFLPAIVSAKLQKSLTAYGWGLLRRRLGEEGKLSILRGVRLFLLVRKS